MGLFNKKKPELETPVTQTEQDTSVGTAADVEAVMKKYDRESNTRVWEGAPSLVIRALMALFAAYTIVDTVFLSILPQRRLPIFMGVLLFIGFLTFPARKGESRVNHMPWYDIILLIVGPGAYFFYAINAEKVINMSAMVMQNHLYMIIGLIGILALVELCRRCVGIPILCVAGVLLVYTFVNLMGGSAVTFENLRMTLYQVIRTMFYTNNGIFGNPVNVCAKFIMVFIIFRCLPGAHRHCQLLYQPGQCCGWLRLPAVLPRWQSFPRLCAAWCPAPPWAIPSPPVPSPFP